MLRNGSPIREFRLNFQTKTQNSVLNSWISAVLLHEVWVVNIAVKKYEENAGGLPSQICRCRNICGTEIVQSWRWRLQNWLLCQVSSSCFLNMWDYFGENSEWKLFKEFPLLEKLVMDSCLMRDMQVLNISIPSLIKLSLFPNPHSVFSIVIDTPNLLKFNYSDVCREILVKELKFLVRADLHVSFYYFKEDFDRVQSSKCVYNQLMDWIMQSFSHYRLVR